MARNDIPYGPSPHPLWLTIFTSMFLHGGLLHIGGNMLYLWIFGNNIEDALGKGRFLLFYLVCGLAASAAQIAIDPNSLIPNVGASGAIAGVLGAYFILYPNARVLSLVPIFIYFLAEVRAFWVLLLWIVLNVFQGVVGLGIAARRGRGPLRPHRRLLRGRPADPAAGRAEAGRAAAAAGDRLSRPSAATGIDRTRRWPYNLYGGCSGTCPAR